MADKPGASTVSAAPAQTPVDKAVAMDFAAPADAAIATKAITLYLSYRASLTRLHVRDADSAASVLVAHHLTEA